MKVLLDTNVLFAVFAMERGICVDVFRRCLVRHELVLCKHILTELQRHLSAKTRLSASKVREVIQTLRSAAIMVEPATLPPDACRDPDDLPVLGAAVAGHAEVLITGDQDLLVLRERQGVSILSPRQFFDRFVANG